MADFHVWQGKPQNLSLNNLEHLKIQAWVSDFLHQSHHIQTLPVLLK